MPYLRTFWHFMPKTICIRELYTQLLQNFLQWCYSTILKLELYCSSILKNINILFTFSPEISLSSISLFQFSSLSSFSVSPSALSSLQTQTPFSSQHQHHTSQWLIFSSGLQSDGFYGWVSFFFFFAVTGA